MTGTKTVLTYISEQLETMEAPNPPYKPNSLSASYVEGQIMALKKLRDKIVHSEVM